MDDVVDAAKQKRLTSGLRDFPKRMKRILPRIAGDARSQVIAESTGDDHVDQGGKCEPKGEEPLTRE